MFGNCQRLSSDAAFKLKVISTAQELNEFSAAAIELQVHENQVSKCYFPEQILFFLLFWLQYWLVQAYVQL